MESDLFLQYSDGPLAMLIVQAAVWLVVVVACLLAVRRPWAWPGLAGGVLGLTVAVTFLIDELKVRSDLGQLTHGYPVVGPPDADLVLDVDYPGFLQDQDLYGLLGWVQTTSLALVAIAFATGSVLSRRRGEPRSQA